MLKKCPKCTLEKSVEEFGRCASRPDGLSFHCKPCTNLRHALYRERHAARLNPYKKEWAERNRESVAATKRASAEKHRENRNARLKIRGVEDTLFNLRLRVRNRLNICFRRKGYGKSTGTAALIGCSWEFLKGYLEGKFEPGMCWQNRGLWHIDHIVPLNSATTVEELEALCHYTNLQPLWAYDNIAKSDKI